MRVETGIVVVMIAMLLILAWAGISDYKENKEWEQFAIEHQCKVVSKTKGQVFNTFATNPNGGSSVGIASTNATTSYLCDDGITYTR